MELYYTPKTNIENNIIKITGEEFHHIKNVMRHKVGDIIYITDGEGNEYKAEIEKITKTLIQAKVLNSSLGLREPKAKVTLAQCLIKGNRMDIAIEKATELGTYAILPVVSSRTIARLTENKKKHFRNIMISAMKSSTRTYLPKLYDEIAYQELLTTADNYDLALLGWEAETKLHLTEINFNNINTVLLIIGPEGGFTDDEIALANSKNITLFSLGPRRLRAETAAISALSIILAKMNEI
ncbi:MAG: 16S rRNA (uracil(1498)-N(3))-methyltransferase [candidate division WOR-3 bacterium]|nr:16S rRNA (uracil(1498)-N(3))-methyltransferase [candidate division WOR-3 bacterium]MCX7757749.1 16S rRNA (uracil(1498)-N(3))-methyltransferase [candidate division WOR-3 bacterium]MDW7988040.1 RsmE family RNA methyltransferase [candidate division WOR-3 bacterium]